MILQRQWMVSSIMSLHNGGSQTLSLMSCLSLELTISILKPKKFIHKSSENYNLKPLNLYGLTAQYLYVCTSRPYTDIVRRGGNFSLSHLLSQCLTQTHY